MRRILVSTCVAIGLVAAAGTASAQRWGGDDGYDRGNGRLIRCESPNDKFARCYTRGRVEIVRQLSRTKCVEGRNWGQDREGLWVKDGCRADFAARGGGWNDDRPGRPGNGWGPGNGGDYGRVINCSSSDGRQQYCPADIRRNVRLVRQLSSSRCIEGRSWGWDRRGVWVTDGCRGEFAIN